MKSPPSILGMVLMWLIISIALTIMGPFGTMFIPLQERLPYWLGLMAVSCLKWWLWFRITGPLVGWRERDMALMGILSVFILHLTLPFEVQVANRLVGGPVPAYLNLYGTAVALGLVICGGIEAARWGLRRRQTAGTRDTSAMVPPPPPDMAATALPLSIDPPTGGLLLRAGVSDPAQVMAVEAEDHYLRLHLSDGRKPLVLYRLRDAMAELSHLDGEQVHRGYWVAGQAVRGLERRDGRKWALRLEGGLLVPVSATFMPMVRKRGWPELSPALER